MNFSYWWGKTETFLHLLFYASCHEDMAVWINTRLHAAAGRPLFRVDRDTELSSKTKGGGICFDTNSSWCNYVTEPTGLETMLSLCSTVESFRFLSTIITQELTMTSPTTDVLCMAAAKDKDGALLHLHPHLLHHHLVHCCHCQRQGQKTALSSIHSQGHRQQSAIPPGLLHHGPKEYR